MLIRSVRVYGEDLRKFIHKSLITFARVLLRDSETVDNHHYRSKYRSIGKKYLFEGK